MLRSILGVVLGLVLAGLLIAVVQSFSWRYLYPLPPGIDLTDPIAIGKAIEAMPPQALMMVLLSYAVGIVPGAWLAAKIAAKQYVLHAGIIGLLFVAASFGVLRLMPHPQWFQVSNLAMILPNALFGGWLASRR